LEPDDGWRIVFIKVTQNGLADVDAQLLSRVSLGDDGLVRIGKRQAVDISHSAAKSG
jgi:hypothetical protein